MRDPLAKLDPPYSTLVDLVEVMPTVLRLGTFREAVDAERDAFDTVHLALQREEKVDVLERVHSLYGYISKGYVHGTEDAEGTYNLPEFLSAGYLAVSGKLGRHPTIDYADCVLCNWERVDPTSGITPENIRILNRFTGEAARRSLCAVSALTFVPPHGHGPCVRMPTPPRRRMRWVPHPPLPSPPSASRAAGRGVVPQDAHHH